MTIKKVLSFSNPAEQQLLLTSAAPIESITDSVKQLAADMLETIEHQQAEGLAAVQIGEHVRMFVLNTHEEGNKYKVYINPKIFDASVEMIPSKEGCLSFPGIYIAVKRHETVDVTYTTLEGEEVSEQLTGFLAVAFQHELDHLDGLTFLNRVGPTLRRLTMKKIEKQKRTTKQLMKRLEKQLKGVKINDNVVVDAPVGSL
ncbi:peptide deformylase [bacterium]|nr:peptide deformylase [bacterium]